MMNNSISASLTSRLSLEWKYRQSIILETVNIFHVFMELQKQNWMFGEMRNAEGTMMDTIKCR